MLDNFHCDDRYLSKLVLGLALSLGALMEILRFGSALNREFSGRNADSRFMKNDFMKAPAVDGAPYAKCQLRMLLRSDCSSAAGLYDPGFKHKQERQPRRCKTGLQISILCVCKGIMSTIFRISIRFPWLVANIRLQILGQVG